jgi:hypothetical protein
MNFYDPEITTTCIYLPTASYKARGKIMPKYNIFEEGIKDLPLRARLRHRRLMFLTKVKFEWDNFLYYFLSKIKKEK